MNEIKKIWWLSLLFKLVLSCVLPLSADEAYYWVWSNHLQLSYFDHPPMVSWLFWVGHLFESIGNAVRWPAVILGHATLLLWVGILQNILSVSRIKLWLYVVLFSPLLGFGSIIVTPDIPIVFFWSYSLWTFINALNSRSLKDYFLFGLALGLGFCSKYHIVLFIPCLLAYLSFEKKWSRVSLKGVTVTFFSGLIFSLPVLIWNIQNNFASFEFQLKHGLEKSAYNPEWTLGYLLGQIFIIFPVIIYAAIKSTRFPNTRVFSYFAWLPIGFFFLTSFRALVEANWPIIAYPAILALACIYGLTKNQLRLYFVVFGSAYLAVIATLFVPSIRNINEKISEPYHMREIAHDIKGFNNIYGSSYQISSSLWYFTKKPVYKIRGISRFDFFDSLERGEPKSEEFYLVKKKTDHFPDWLTNNSNWTSTELKSYHDFYQLLKLERSK